MNTAKKLMVYFVLSANYLGASEAPLPSLDELKKQADLEYASFEKELADYDSLSNDLRSKKIKLIQSKKPTTPENNLEIDKQIRILEGRLQQAERKFILQHNKSLTSNNDYLLELIQFMRIQLIECNQNRAIENKALEDCQSELADMIATEDLFPQPPDQVIKRPNLKPLKFNQLKSDN